MADYEASLKENLSIAERLDNSQKQVLKFLEKRQGLSPEDIGKETGLEADTVRHEVARLSDLGLVRVYEKKEKYYVLGTEGIEAVKNGLPEEEQAKRLSGGRKKVKITDLSEKDRVAFSNAKRKGLVSLDANSHVTVNDKALHSPDQEKALLEKVMQKGRLLESEAGDFIGSIQSLKKRGTMLLEKDSTERKVFLTEKGGQIAGMRMEFKEEVSQLTPEMIQTGAWKKASFRKYNLNMPVPQAWPGRKHPQRLVMERAQKVFTEMGFKEMKGPWVETAFWNMDSMFIPQDHPSREVQDTFYLEGKGDLPDKKLVAAVKDVQETGGKTGSKGNGGEWSPEIASRLLLRTHTTATTFRKFGLDKVRAPCKYYSIARVFRNEAVDATHLPEFHQIEGFVMGENITVSNMLGFLKEFYEKMGFRNLKFKPTYNPYTEPSVEISAYSPELGRMVEVGNSGMFRPESLAPYGVPENVRVVAWGLAVERLAMMLYKKDDIRKFVGSEQDMDWLRNYQLL